MSHFARIDENNIVVEVIVAEEDFINSLPNPADWIQTSYNGNFRGVFAGIGYTYDEGSDTFVPPPYVKPEGE